MLRTVTAVICCALVAVALVMASAEAAPQGTDAAVAAAAAKPTPRTADGRPDLSGMWYRRVAGPVTERVGKSIVRVAGTPTVPDRYDPGRPRYKPEFFAKVKELTDDQINVDPAFHCGPPGLPRIGPPQRIFQTPREIVILYDDLNGNFFRVIPIDGRKHRASIEPSSLGDSVGRWEGDTLVVEVRKLLEDTWLGDNGLFHTENTKITERLTRKGDTLTWDVTVEDPEVFVAPWKLNPRTLTLTPSAEIEEAAFCEDRGIADRVTKDYHGNVR
ncbi:MAG: hypothetical protein HYY76_05600 [Acidobacteria bacterium]|nr:hypothetical protein [Acidobacteriota bacterium]